jgi:hypothetical protein
MTIKDYTIKVRWFDSDGWHTVEHDLTDTYESATYAAIRTAKEMDVIHGDKHQWNVELWDNPRGEYGAYYEWFHGRTS